MAVHEPEPVVIEESLIFDEPVEDTIYYPQSMIFILDRTQNKIGVLNNDVPKALGYFNDVFTESIQSNLSTLEFEVQSNHDTANLLKLEGFVIYTNPTNNKQHLFTIKEIEDIHSTTMIRRVFCESSATTELLSTIVRPVNMVSVTLEQALGIVLNQTGYSIGNIDFAGLRDINIETHTTALEALHRVVAEFGEMEFEVIFDGTQIKRKQVNVVRKRGKETGKIFEYTRNLTEIKKISDSNSVITALIGVGKDDANGNPLTFFTNEPRVLESQVVNPNLLSNAQSNPTNINFLQGWTVKGDVIESISSHIPANVDGVTNSLVITQTGVTDAERVNNFMCINTAENKTVIEPLKEYKFSVWLKSNADLMDGMSLSVVMEFYDSKMAQTGQFEKRFYVNADQWIKMELTGLAPANSKYANVEARVYYSITGETLHWTGAELRKLETAYTTGNQALTGLEEVEPRFVMINDYIADLEAFERYNKNGKHIFGVFIDDVSTNPIELYERTLKKLKELSTPKTTYECSIVSFEQLTGLDFYRVEVGDRVVVKDFEFSNNNPLLLNARIIEKKISFDPSNSKITLGNYSIAQVNENQGRILKQFQKVIMKKEAEWDSANVKAEEAIEKANESYEVAEVAQGTATEANEKAEQAITDVANKLDQDIYEQEQNAIVATIAEKANLEYVNGVLVDKVNKGDVFTKTEIEETLLGFVSELTYETDQTGLVTRLELAESDIQQTKEGFKATVTKADLEAIQIGAKNYIRNADFRNGLNYYTTSGTVAVNDLGSLSGFDKVMFASSASNGYAGVTITNIIKKPNDWLNKSVVLSFYAIYENVVQGVNAWEKLNGGLYFQCKFTDGTTAWVYPQLPLSVVGTDYEWKRYAQHITFDVANGKQIAEILDIKVKFLIENATGMAWATGFQLETGDYVTDFTPHPEDGEKIAVGFAESQFTQTAELIATKVEKDGVISAINQTAEMVEIQANKINLDGFVEAKHIKSLNGLVVGNDNQFVVDTNGNVTFSGTLSGADGTFSGNLVGGRVEVDTDVYVGHNIYLAYEYEKRFDEKGIVFYDGRREGYENGIFDTRIEGTYLKMDIICNNQLNLLTDGTLNVISKTVRMDGQLWLNSIVEPMRSKE